MAALICFDLDGTLTPHSTWLAFNTRLGISLEDDKRLFIDFREGKITYTQWLNALMELYKKNGLLTKKELQETAQSLELRPEALAVIDTAKAKGYEVVIISGAVDVMAHSVAKRLGVENVLTVNKALFDEQEYLVGMAEASGEQAAKLELLQNFCDQHQYELSEVIAVGDGGNDREIFKHTKGIMLGNDKDLAPIAWKQIDTLSELEALL